MIPGEFTAGQETPLEPVDVESVQTTPLQYICKIKVTGRDQMSRKKVITASRLKKFTRIKPESVENAGVTIRDAYKIAGYPEPDVNITLSESRSDGGTLVTIAITESPLTVPDSFETSLTGTPWFWEKIRLKVYTRYYRWRSLRKGFNQAELEKNLKKSQKRIRRNQYLEAEFTITQSPDSSEISVNLDVGSRHKVKLKGTGYSVRKEVLKTWRKRALKLTDLEKRRLVRRTKNTLEEKGYFDAELTQSDTDNETRKTFIITVDRGKRHRVENIVFKGNTRISDAELIPAAGIHPPRFFGLSKSYPGPETLTDSEKSLAGYYASRGYPHARIKARLMPGSGHLRTVEFEVEEGPQVRMTEISFHGIEDFTSDELLAVTGLTEGAIFRVSAISDANIDLQKFYRKNGYLDVSVQRKINKISETEAGIEFTVTEGQLNRLGATVIRGNFKTRAGTILKARNIHRGEPVSPEIIVEMEKELYEQGVFDTVSVRLEPVPGEDEEKLLVIDLTERSTGKIVMGTDFNTDRGFEASLLLQEGNLLGRAIQGTLAGAAGENYNMISGRLRTPYLFNWKIINTLKLQYEDDATHESFSMRTTEAAAGLHYEFTEDLEGFLGYLFKSEDAYDVKSDVDEGVDYETGSFGAIIPRLDWDTRNDPFTPEKGMFSSIQCKYSRPFLGGDQDFIKLDFQTLYFHGWENHIVLAAAIRVGFAWETGDSSLPLSERYFLGGAGTHRAFKHNKLSPLGVEDSSLGGTSYLLTNLELRIPIWESLEAGIFLDAGNVFLEMPESPLFRPGTGFGLRYLTPIGPIRGDIGFNLDREPGEDSYAFHFAIGHAF